MADPEKKTILIVDDDQDALGTYKRIAELNGYAVETAASADEALRILAPTFFIVWCDGLDGGYSKVVEAAQGVGIRKIAVVSGDGSLMDEVVKMGAQFYHKDLGAKAILSKMSQ